MLHVVMIQGTGILKKYLGKLPATGNRNGYVIFEEMNAGDRVSLEEKGFSEIKPPQINDKFRDEFLREYIKLVGSLGKEFNSRRWWGTDIASKNRFTSGLPYLLHQFVKVEQILRNEYFDVLVILNPPWLIVSALKELLRKNAIKHDYLKERNAVTVRVRLKICGKILGVLYNMFKVIMLMVYAKSQLRESIKKVASAETPYYVVKTFIYDHSFSQDGSYRDVFFGILPDFLKRNNKELLIYAAILGNYKYCTTKIKECREQVIIPVEALLSITDILQAAVQIFFCRFRIRKELLFFENDVKTMAENLLTETFNGLQYYQFLHYWATRRLVAFCSVDSFLLTYENNPWEKMCVMAVKEHSPDTVIIGYQHTVIPQASANMFVSREEREVVPMPDKILTVGSAPKDIMERYGHYERGKIEPACGLRFEYLFDILPSKRGHSNTILLALEGIYDVYKMVNYAFKELKDSPYAVIIRTHPVLPLEKMRRDIPKELWLNSNFQLSKQNSLKHDIESSDIVMYWGSTVALEALSMGKPVIHFETGSVLSYDPLFECNYLKWKVSKQDPLIEKINEIYALSEDEFYAQQEKARAYLRNYFYPVTDDSLMRFIEEDKLHAGINIS